MRKVSKMSGRNKPERQRDLQEVFSHQNVTQFFIQSLTLRCEHWGESEKRNVDRNVELVRRSIRNT